MDVLHCLCGIASVADIVLPSVPVVDGIDCASKIISTVETTVTAGIGFGAVYGVLTVFDCASIVLTSIVLGVEGAIVGSVAGPLGVAIYGGGGMIIGLTPIGEAIADAQIFALQNLLGAGGATCLPISQIDGCLKVLGVR